MKTQQWKQQDLWNKHSKHWNSCLVKGQVVIPFPQGHDTAHALSVVNSGAYNYISAPRSQYLIKKPKAK